MAFSMNTSSEFSFEICPRDLLFFYQYLELNFLIVGIFCFSGHPRQYSVFLDCWDEHGKLHVPDVSQTIFGAVRQCYGKVRD